MLSWWEDSVATDGYSSINKKMSPATDKLPSCYWAFSSSSMYDLGTNYDIVFSYY